MQTFNDKVKDGPEFVCCVCLRFYFIHQVLSCDRHVYVEILVAFLWRSAVDLLHALPKIA